MSTRRNKLPRLSMFKKQIRRISTASTEPPNSTEKKYPKFIPNCIEDEYVHLNMESATHIDLTTDLNYFKPQSDKENKSHFTPLPIKSQKLLFDWLYQVCDKLSIRLNTTYFTTFYIFHFLYNRYTFQGKIGYPTNTLQMGGSCALLISSKWIDITNPLLTELVRMCDGAIPSEEEFSRFEMSELSKIFQNSKVLFKPSPMEYIVFLNNYIFHKSMKNIFYELCQICLVFLTFNDYVFFEIFDGISHRLAISVFIHVYFKLYKLPRTNDLFSSVSEIFPKLTIESVMRDFDLMKRALLNLEYRDVRVCI